MSWWADRCAFDLPCGLPKDGLLTDQRWMDLEAGLRRQPGRGLADPHPQPRLLEPGGPHPGQGQGRLDGGWRAARLLPLFRFRPRPAGRALQAPGPRPRDPRIAAGRAAGRLRRRHEEEWARNQPRDPLRPSEIPYIRAAWSLARCAAGDSQRRARRQGLLKRPHRRGRSLGRRPRPGSRAGRHAGRDPHHGPGLARRAHRFPAGSRGRPARLSPVLRRARRDTWAPMRSGRVGCPGPAGWPGAAGRARGRRLRTWDEAPWTGPASGALDWLREPTADDTPRAARALLATRAATLRAKSSPATPPAWIAWCLGPEAAAQAASPRTCCRRA